MQKSPDDFDHIEPETRRSLLIERILDETDEDSTEDDHIEKTLDEILEDFDVFEQFVADLKPLDKVHSKNFYDFYLNTSQLLGYSQQANSFLGRLWAWTFNRVNSPEQEWMCSHFVDCFDFFTPFHTLPDILENIEIDSLSLSNWLIAIRKRLGTDGASWPLSNGLSVLATSSPDLSIEIIELWNKQKLDEDVIWMAAALLGKLRCNGRAEDTEVESLGSRGNEQQKFIYFRSMRFSDREKTLPDKEYEQLITQIEMHSSDSLDETLGFVISTINSEKRSNLSFEYAHNWIIQHIPDDQSDWWRHQIICLSKTIHKRSLELGLVPLFKSLQKVLPIPKKHEGTRREMDSLLAYLHTDHPEHFNMLLHILAGSDRFTLDKIFDIHSHQETIRAISANDAEKFAFEYLSSLDECIRHVGFLFLQHTSAGKDPAPNVSSWSDRWIAVLVYEILSHDLYDSTVAKIILFLLPRVESSDNDKLISFFIYQVVYHMKNLPGECLETLKKSPQAKKSKLLKDAIKQADQYFDNLRPSHDSAINSMQISGLNRASRILSVKRSRDIEKTKDESSALLNLFPTSYLLYGGKKWQTYVNGTLGDISELKQQSVSMELPRFLASDPDGYAVRRYNARQSIKNLEKEEEKFRQESK